MTVAESIARQQAEKLRLSNIIKTAENPRQRRKAITPADVRNAVRNALSDVARELRLKAKETPGWAAAYHSACAVVEKKSSEVK